MLCSSLLRMMDCLSFDKVQVKTEALKAVRSRLVRKLNWSLGLTDMHSNVWRSGRSKIAEPLVVQTYLNIASVVTLCQNTPQLLVVGQECSTAEKCNLWGHHANQHLGCWCVMTELHLYGCFSYNIFHPSHSSYLTPILTTHNHSKHWGKSQQSNGRKVLCSALLVESVSADRQDHLRTGALKIKQDTLNV